MAQEDYHALLPKLLEKLRIDPSTITPDEARRLHEHYDAKDERSARVIGAIEALAAAHDDIPAVANDPELLHQEGHASLLTLIEDLKAAVETSPREVTPEMLKLMQGTVAKMQKAIGNTTAPHPELEKELLQEYKNIGPKINDGTVTKAEADHLHSLEARAHGHTEKGGLTSMAQSVAAKRERQMSLSENSNKAEFLAHHPEFPMSMKGESAVPVAE